MFRELFRNLFYDRKGSIALVVAITLVPMMIAGITAIDMARISAARTVLQAAVDSAAISGAGAYSTAGTGGVSSTTESVTPTQAAINAAEAIYAGATASLGGMTTSLTSSTSPSLVTTYCSVSGCSNSGSMPAACDSAAFCVKVTASLTLNNLLLKWIVPQTFLTANAFGVAGATVINVNAGSFTSTNVPDAADNNTTLGYVVPTNGSVTEFGELPSSAGCSSTITSVLPPSTSSSSSSSTCNYVQIGSSTGGSATGTLQFTSGQYIAFAFANLTGGTSNYGVDSNYKYYDNVSVGGNSYTNGACVYNATSTSGNSYTTTTVSTTTKNSSGHVTTTGPTTTYSPTTTTGPTIISPSTPGSCTAISSTGTVISGPTTMTSNPVQVSCGHSTCTETTTTVTTTYSGQYISESGTPLYGECPQHNLYGSMSEGSGGTDSNGNTMTYNGATSSDSLTVYSSANEVLGYPTTHNVNHVMPPFTTTMQESVSNTSYSVSIQCPHFPVTAAQAQQDGYTSQVPYNTDIMATPGTGTGYSTYYPDATFTDETSSIYPPALQSGCSPAASYPATANNSVSNSWWGWSASNTGNCANQPTINVSGQTTYNPSYNNCELIIQPLGLAQSTTVTSGYNVPAASGTPTLPSYYVEVKNSSGAMVVLDPVYNAATFTDIQPGVISALVTKYKTSTNGSVMTSSTLGLRVNANGTITSTKSSSFVPPTTTYSATLGSTIASSNGTSLSGDTASITQPANDSLYYLPADTSHRCYNPQQNGYTAADITGANDNGTANDQIANPEYGALDCTRYAGYSFGLYWNDGGSSAIDDLGYWNAVTLFTCPSPTYTPSTTAPARLSG